MSQKLLPHEKVIHAAYSLGLLEISSEIYMKYFIIYKVPRKYKSSLLMFADVHIS